MKICDETVRAAVDSGLGSVQIDAAQKQAILAQCRPTVAVAPPARRLRPMKRVLALAAAFALVLCLGGGVLAAAPELQQKLAVLGEETLQMLQPINQVSEDVEHDNTFYEGTSTAMSIRPGMFYIMFPSDGHKAACHQEFPKHYRKVVVKIPV